MNDKIDFKGRLLGAHCSIAGSVANAPVIGGQVGCSAIQIFTSSNRQWRVADIAEDAADLFKVNLKECGIEICFSHAMYLINLAAPDDEVFSKSVDGMAGELRRAKLLGLPFVVIHPGSPKDLGIDWGVRRAAEAIDRAYDEVGDCDVRIALETTAGQGTALGRRFDEIAKIISSVGDPSRVGACLDSCHVFAAGYDIRDRDIYDDMWREFDSTIGLKKLMALHLNDSLAKFASNKDRHAEIGEGEIGGDAFSFILNDDRLKGIPMVLETPKGDDPVANDRKNLRVLARLIK